MKTSPADHFHVSLNTPAGQVTTEVAVPTGFIPITAIVPLMRSIGGQMQELEQGRAVDQGQVISCQKGCAACCRMLVPLSAPEAFAFKQFYDRLPAERQRMLRSRIESSQARLHEAGLLAPLNDVAESDSPLTDDTLEPLNRAYYALRIPCPFLEDEQCTIYEERPAACRELLVTSPPELCRDLTNPAIQALPVSVRVTTTFGLLWAELTGTAERLIPLPVALDWALRHQEDCHRTWPGNELFDKLLDKVWRYLSHELHRRKTPSE
ncbi:MAG: YkgJ family cysteine cluster protein [Nitrospiraceae bacterium]